MHITNVYPHAALFCLAQNWMFQQDYALCNRAKAQGVLELKGNFLIDLSLCFHLLTCLWRSQECSGKYSVTTMEIKKKNKGVRKLFTAATPAFINLQSDQHNCSRVHITDTDKGLTWMVSSSQIKQLVHHWQGIHDFCWVNNKIYRCFVESRGETSCALE